MTDKIGGHETEWHNINANGRPIAGKTPFETVKIKGIEFIVIGQSGGTYSDRKTAEHALDYCQQYGRAGIKVVRDRQDTEHFVIVSPSSHVGEVHQEILSAFSNNNGNPVYQNIDAIVDRFSQQSAGRVRTGVAGMESDRGPS